VKTELFGYNSVRELNTKNMSNSPSFLSVTHTILSAKQFRSYRILRIGKLLKTELDSTTVGKKQNSED
jgi:hypothetical protein